MRFSLITIMVLPALLVGTSIRPVAAQEMAGGCVRDPSGRTATQWLSRAASAVGMTRSRGRVLSLTVSHARDLADQSDRAYPPFIQEIGAAQRLFDPATGVERFSLGRGAVLRGPQSSYRVVGDSLVAAPDLFANLTAQREFNPWAVLSDWARDSGAAVAGRCPYLDFTRVVLTRRVPLGRERLYLDAVSGFPMMLQSVELHYFLGPVHDEYRYSAWSDVAPSIYYPSSTIKTTDGLGQETWSAFPGQAVLTTRDSAPPLTIPDSPMANAVAPPRFGDQAVDTVRVSSATFLLVNPRFTSVVSLIADTVFLFDAPAGEQRARRDSAWIGTLFPGRHPIALVALSPVWPHIAGLRYWVASGARIIGNRLTAALVSRAVARRWTEYTDQLERTRSRVRFAFDTSGDVATRAGGGLRLYALNGAGNEGTMMAYVAHDRFLWASDRIQDIEHPSLYAAELSESVRRARLDPQWTSGPHFRLVPWSAIARLSGAAPEDAVPQR